MQRIIIHQFGPIRNVELEINNLMVFIGPQASGKSTISKSIYFFKSLRDDLIKYFFECIEKNSFNKHMGNYARIIRNKFLQFWGPTYHQSDIHIQYYFSQEKYITLKMKGKYIDPVFSADFQKNILLLAKEIQLFSERLTIRNPSILSSGDYIVLESEKQSFLRKIELEISNLFDDDRALLFIPAGRSLLSTISDQLQTIHPHKLDFLMRAFIDRINYSKPLFGKSLQEIVQDRKMLTYNIVDNETVDLAIDFIEKILKGTYKFDGEGEKIFYEKSKYVKINFASSGQQESIWILLLIFLQILDKTNSFVVFEEPEAHLYPEAQKQIIDLIALLLNSGNNQIVITTHSPYILSSLNNLFFAQVTGLKSKNKVSQLVPEKTWLNSKDAQAYFIENGSLESIIDQETGLLQTEAIDKASGLINKIYYAIFNLDEE
jgi:ABC-type cobalamin/Fe3+-siderophores transport system ATPase subunit